MKAIERTGKDYYCQISDVQLLKELVRSLPDNPLCINIGAGMGTSALAMLEARSDSIVFSIDTEECPEELKLTEQFEEEGRYKFIRNLSQIAGAKWKIEVDLIFVDGGHTYQECYDDAVIWYKTLKTNGIMAFHDYESEIQILESVKRAVDDVMKILNLQEIANKGTLIAFRKT